MRSLREGNVFTRVCLSVSLSVHGWGPPALSKTVHSGTLPVPWICWKAGDWPSTERPP